MYNGAYLLNDGRLSLVGELMSTRMMCYGNEQKTSDYLASIIQQGSKLSVLQNKPNQNKPTQPYKLLQITDAGSQLVWAVSDNKMR